MLCSISGASEEVHNMTTETLLPVINIEECTGCGICVGVCPENALVLRSNVIYTIDNVDCQYCGECEAACPTDAIACPYDIVIE